MIGSFEVWYRAEHPRVLSACMALADDQTFASEATDEAFTRAFEKWEAVRLMAAPGGWVQTVALNQLRRILRRRRLERAHRRKTVSAPIVPDPELWLVVRTLPHRQQTAIVLAYVHGLPGSEIAQLMRISPGTVSSTLDAARRGLRRRLTDQTTSEDVLWRLN